jgi:uncharacterized protein DUF4440
MRVALRLLFLLFGLALAASGLTAQEPASLDRTVLLVSNSARFTAMVRGDLTALDTLLGPELSYIHSDGALESKAQFLATLRTGRLRYQAIEPADLKTRLYGDVGIVTGRSRIRVLAGSELLQFSIRFTAIYRHTAKSWVLVAWQATRLP